MPPAPVELHIVSDATGETATRLVAALEAQFPEQPFEEIRHPRVETVDDLRLVVDRAKGRPAVVVYTIVKPELREAMRDFCRRAKLHYCDILGPPLASIAKISGQAAQMAPGRPAPARLGVLPPDRARSSSRSSTTTAWAAGSARRTSCSSASRGRRRRRSRCTSATWATRPRTSRSCSGIEPPQELFELDPAKIVGLTIDAGRLAEIRQERVRQMRANPKAYAELVEIYDELEHADAIHRRLGCPVLDITELSIEETASRVIKLVEERKRAAPAPNETEAARPALALGALVGPARRSGCSSSTCCSRRSGSACARSPGWPSSGRGGAAETAARRATSRCRARPGRRSRPRARTDLGELGADEVEADVRVGRVAGRKAPRRPACGRRAAQLLVVVVRAGAARKEAEAVAASPRAAGRTSR